MTSPPTTTAIARTADSEASAASNLVLSDLPSGWTASPRATAADRSAVAVCLGTSAASSAAAPSSASPAFRSPDGTRTISSTVRYLADDAAAHERHGVIDGPKVPACLSTSLRDALQSRLSSVRTADMKVGAPHFVRSTFPSVGDETTAYRFELPVALSGKSLTVGADRVFIRKGRVEITLSFETMSSLLPVEEEQHYAEVVVSRVAMR